jgi:hypothetical protein
MSGDAHRRELNPRARGSRRDPSRHQRHQQANLQTAMPFY